MSDLQLSQPDSELIKLYVRFAALQKKLVELHAELDNVYELIRQKEM